MDVACRSVHAFPKGSRLRNRAEFLRVGRRGRRVHTGDCVILVDRNGLTKTRLGITVSRQAGNAVKRNRAKRLVREYFRLHRERFATGHDIVVIVKDAQALSRLRDVEKNFEHFFRKATFLEGAGPGREARPRLDKGL